MASNREEKKQTSTGIQHQEDPFQDESTHGNLIAVEGDAEAIDVQLRLLPPSSKILILSSLKDCVPTQSGRFSARQFVRDVHAAFTARSETARAFLQSSTSSQPRLVFMNGGCVGARAACMTRIAENITNGNVQAAEKILDGILRNGVAGLSRDDQLERGEAGETPDEDTEVPRGAVQNPHQLSDPSSVAMRAAEDLDRETAELQPKVEHKIGGSTIAPTLAHSDTIYPLETPRMSEKVFTDVAGGVFQETVPVVPSRSASLNDKRSTFGHHSSYTANTVYTEIFSQDEQNSDSESDAGDYCCSRAEELLSTAQTPAVEFGQACIIDMQSARPSFFGRKRSASLDLFLDNRTYSNICSRRGSIKRTTSGAHVSDRPSTSDGLPRLRTTFLEVSEMTIRRSLTRSARSSDGSHSSDGRVYVDRGTDPIEFSEDEPVSKAPFQPVFPIIEDLIISFAHDNWNLIIDSAIQSYKNGTCIPLPPSEPHSAPPSPHDSRFTRGSSSEKDTTSFQALPQRHGSKMIQNPGTTTTAPLTPASTPPPRKIGVAHKFLSFVPQRNLTPVAIQNAFRVLLTTQFPPSSTGLKQYTYASEVDRLWKPVFRFEDTSGKESRTVDQIIAIGCEDNVRKDLLSEIAGGIEKLGRKKNGISRSGRLDIGYLIANAMQTYINIDPSIAPASPLSNPAYLASLIVPYLEFYLAANPMTRLLILQYSADYFPVILCLRALIGTEILKIAGITEHKPASLSPKLPPILSNEGAEELKSRNRFMKQMSSSKGANYTIFAKANFQLSEFASPSEIDHFYSQIQCCLLDKSSFYMPEPPSPVLKPLIPAKSANRLALSSTNKLERSECAVNSTKSSESEDTPYMFSRAAKMGVVGIPAPDQGDRPVPRMARAKSRTHSPSRSMRAESSTPSFCRREKAWEDFDLSDEEDEDDQRIMSPGKQKGDSRKALKWLGLLA